MDGMITGAVKPMEIALKSGLLADVKSHLLNLTADELLHFGVAAPLRNCFISCLIERGSRSRLRICWECLRVAFWEGSAVFAFYWAIGQVSKPGAIACHHACDLRLHLGKGLPVGPRRAPAIFISWVIGRGAIIPVNEAMKIRQVADVEALPDNLPPDEEGHLMMTAQRGGLLISFFIKFSKGTGCVAVKGLQMVTDLTSILVRL